MTEHEDFEKENREQIAREQDGWYAESVRWAIENDRRQKHLFAYTKAGELFDLGVVLMKIRREEIRGI